MRAAIGGQSSKGASAVEFALIVPLLLLIVLFMIDAGRALFIQAALQNAAHQSAYALATGATPAQVAAISSDTGATAVAIAASNQAEVALSIVQDCPPAYNPAALDSAVVILTADFVFFTPIALIQRFDQGATDPGVIQINTQSQWLCTG